MSKFAKFPLSAYIAPFAIVGLGLLMLVVAGCNQSAMDAKTVAAHRTRLVLAEEPEGVQTVADVRLTLLGEPEHVHDHEDHDHDGDGIQDHAAEDHDAAEHDGDHDEDAHEDHDHDGDGHEDHEADDHDEDAEDHDDHDHEGEDHEEHAHDDHDEHAHDDHDEHEHEHEHAHAAESIDVVMVGHIGGLANPWSNTRPEFPFAKTQAIFYLADPLAIAENAEHAHEHSHAPGEECAFCAANAKNQADMLAIVQFVDKNGKVLPVDVRQLFEVKEKDMVVVSGKAHVTPGGILVVDAEGLYIRN